jgi:hypothetical protein
MSLDTPWGLAAWLAISSLLFTALACARTDWIQETLVTVDVTGTWSGSCVRPGTYAAGNIEMTLSGSRVTGQSRAMPGHVSPIEGTVSGDVFRYGSQGYQRGELQVSEDEMSGWAVVDNKSVTCQLRRQASSESPRSP